MTFGRENFKPKVANISIGNFSIAKRQLNFGLANINIKLLILSWLNVVCTNIHASSLWADWNRKNKLLNICKSVKKYIKKTLIYYMSLCQWINININI